MILELVVIALSLLVIGGVVLRRILRPVSGTPSQQSQEVSTASSYAEIPSTELPERIALAFTDQRWQAVLDLFAYAKRTAPHVVSQEMILMASQSHFELGNFQSSLALYEEILASAPTEAEHHANVAQIQLKLKAVDKAIKHLNQAISLDTGNVTYYYELAQALRRGKKHDEARVIRQKAVALETKQSSSV